MKAKLCAYNPTTATVLECSKEFYYQSNPKVCVLQRESDDGKEVIEFQYGEEIKDSQKHCGSQPHPTLEPRTSPYCIRPSFEARVSLSSPSNNFVSYIRNDSQFSSSVAKEHLCPAVKTCSGFQLETAINDGSVVWMHREKIVPHQLLLDVQPNTSHSNQQSWEDSFTQDEKEEITRYAARMRFHFHHSELDSKIDLIRPLVEMKDPTLTPVSDKQTDVDAKYEAYSFLQHVQEEFPFPVHTMAVAQDSLLDASGETLEVPVDDLFLVFGTLSCEYVAQKSTPVWKGVIQTHTTKSLTRRHSGSPPGNGKGICLVDGVEQAKYYGRRVVPNHNTANVPTSFSSLFHHRGLFQASEVVAVSVGTFQFACLDGYVPVRDQNPLETVVLCDVREDPYRESVFSAQLSGATEFRCVPDLPTCSVLDLPDDTIIGNDLLDSNVLYYEGDYLRRQGGVAYHPSHATSVIDGTDSIKTVLPRCRVSADGVPYWHWNRDATNAQLSSVITALQQAPTCNQSPEVLHDPHRHEKLVQYSHSFDTGALIIPNKTDFVSDLVRIPCSLSGAVGWIFDPRIEPALASLSSSQVETVMTSFNDWNLQCGPLELSQFLKTSTASNPNNFPLTVKLDDSLRVSEVSLQFPHDACQNGFVLNPLLFSPQTASPVPPTSLLLSCSSGSLLWKASTVDDANASVSIRWVSSSSTQLCIPNSSGPSEPEATLQLSAMAMRTEIGTTNPSADAAKYKVADYFDDIEATTACKDASFEVLECALNYSTMHFQRGLQVVSTSPDSKDLHFSLKLKWPVPTVTPFTLPSLRRSFRINPRSFEIAPIFTTEVTIRSVGAREGWEERHLNLKTQLIAGAYGETSRNSFKEFFFDPTDLMFENAYLIGIHDMTLRHGQTFCPTESLLPHHIPYLERIQDTERRYSYDNVVFSQVTPQFGLPLDGIMTIRADPSAETLASRLVTVPQSAKDGYFADVIPWRRSHRSEMVGSVFAYICLPDGTLSKRPDDMPYFRLQKRYRVLPSRVTHGNTGEEEKHAYLLAHPLDSTLSACPVPRSEEMFFGDITGPLVHRLMQSDSPFTVGKSKKSLAPYSTLFLALTLDTGRAVPSGTAIPMNSLGCIHAKNVEIMEQEGRLTYPWDQAQGAFIGGRVIPIGMETTNTDAHVRLKCSEEGEWQYSSSSSEDPRPSPVVIRGQTPSPFMKTRLREVRRVTRGRLEIMAEVLKRFKTEDSTRNPIGLHRLLSINDDEQETLKKLLNVASTHSSFGSVAVAPSYQVKVLGNAGQESELFLDTTFSNLFRCLSPESLAIPIPKDIHMQVELVEGSVEEHATDIPPNPFSSASYPAPVAVFTTDHFQSASFHQLAFSQDLSSEGSADVVLSVLTNPAPIGGVSFGITSLAPSEDQAEDGDNDSDWTKIIPKKILSFLPREIVPTWAVNLDNTTAKPANFGRILRHFATTTQSRICTLNRTTLQNGLQGGHVRDHPLSFEFPMPSSALAARLRREQGKTPLINPLELVRSISSPLHCSHHSAFLPYRYFLDPMGSVGPSTQAPMMAFCFEEPEPAQGQSPQQASLKTISFLSSDLSLSSGLGLRVFSETVSELSFCFHLRSTLTSFFSFFGTEPQRNNKGVGRDFLTITTHNADPQAYRTTVSAIISRADDEDFPYEITIELNSRRFVKLFPDNITVEVTMGIGFLDDAAVGLHGELFEPMISLSTPLDGSVFFVKDSVVYESIFYSQPEELPTLSVLAMAENQCTIYLPDHFSVEIPTGDPDDRATGAEHGTPILYSPLTRLQRLPCEEHLEMGVLVSAPGLSTDQTDWSEKPCAAPATYYPCVPKTYVSQAAGQLPIENVNSLEKSVTNGLFVELTAQQSATRLATSFFQSLKSGDPLEVLPDHFDLSGHNSQYMFPGLVLLSTQAAAITYSSHDESQSLVVSHTTRLSPTTQKYIHVADEVQYIQYLSTDDFQDPSGSCTGPGFEGLDGVNKCFTQLYPLMDNPISAATLSSYMFLERNSAIEKQVGVLDWILNPIEVHVVLPSILFPLRLSSPYAVVVPRENIEPFYHFSSLEYNFALDSSLVLNQRTQTARWKMIISYNYLLQLIMDQSVLWIPEPDSWSPVLASPPVTPVYNLFRPFNPGKGLFSMDLDGRVVWPEDTESTYYLVSIQLPKTSHHPELNHSFLTEKVQNNEVDEFLEAFTVGFSLQNSRMVPAKTDMLTGNELCIPSIATKEVYLGADAETSELPESYDFLLFLVDLASCSGFDIGAQYQSLLLLRSTEGVAPVTTTDINLSKLNIKVFALQSQLVSRPVAAVISMRSRAEIDPLRTPTLEYSGANGIVEDQKTLYLCLDCPFETVPTDIFQSRSKYTLHSSFSYYLDWHGVTESDFPAPADPDAEHVDLDKFFLGSLAGRFVEQPNMTFWRLSVECLDTNDGKANLSKIFLNDGSGGDEDSGGDNTIEVSKAILLDSFPECNGLDSMKKIELYLIPASPSPNSREASIDIRLFSSNPVPFEFVAVMMATTPQSKRNSVEQSASVGTDSKYKVGSIDPDADIDTNLSTLTSTSLLTTQSAAQLHSSTLHFHDVPNHGTVFSSLSQDEAMLSFVGRQLIAAHGGQCTFLARNGNIPITVLTEDVSGVVQIRTKLSDSLVIEEISTSLVANPSMDSELKPKNAVCTGNTPGAPSPGDSTIFSSKDKDLFLQAFSVPATVDTGSGRKVESLSGDGVSVFDWVIPVDATEKGPDDKLPWLTRGERKTPLEVVVLVKFQVSDTLGQRTAFCSAISIVVPLPPAPNTNIFASNSSSPTIDTDPGSPFYMHFRTNVAVKDSSTYSAWHEASPNATTTCSLEEDMNVEGYLPFLMAPLAFNALKEFSRTVLPDIRIFLKQKLSELPPLSVASYGKQADGGLFLRKTVALTSFDVLLPACFPVDVSVQVLSLAGQSAYFTSRFIPEEFLSSLSTEDRQVVEQGCGEVLGLSPNPSEQAVSLREWLSESTTRLLSLNEALTDEQILEVDKDTLSVEVTDVLDMFAAVTLVFQRYAGTVQVMVDGVTEPMVVQDVEPLEGFSWQHEDLTRLGTYFSSPQPPSTLGFSGAVGGALRKVFGPRLGRISTSSLKQFAMRLRETPSLEEGFDIGASVNINEELEHVSLLSLRLQQLLQQMKLRVSLMMLLSSHEMTLRGMSSFTPLRRVSTYISGLENVLASYGSLTDTESRRENAENIAKSFHKAASSIGVNDVLHDASFSGSLSAINAGILAFQAAAENYRVAKQEIADLQRSMQALERSAYSGDIGVLQSPLTSLVKGGSACSESNVPSSTRSLVSLLAEELDQEKEDLLRESSSIINSSLSLAEAFSSTVFSSYQDKVLKRGVQNGALHFSHSARFRYLGIGSVSVSFLQLAEDSSGAVSIPVVESSDGSATTRSTVQLPTTAVSKATQTGRSTVSVLSVKNDISSSALDHEKNTDVDRLSPGNGIVSVDFREIVSGKVIKLPEEVITSPQPQQPRLEVDKNMDYYIEIPVDLRGLPENRRISPGSSCLYSHSYEGIEDINSQSSTSNPVLPEWTANASCVLHAIHEERGLVVCRCSHLTFFSTRISTESLIPRFQQITIDAVRTVNWENVTRNVTPLIILFVWPFLALFFAIIGVYMDRKLYTKGFERLTSQWIASEQVPVTQEIAFRFNQHDSLFFLLWRRYLYNIRDKHMWFSTFFRQTTHNYSSLGRALTGMIVILSSFTLSGMFFGYTTQGYFLVIVMTSVCVFIITEFLRFIFDRTDKDKLKRFLYSFAEQALLLRVTGRSKLAVKFHQSILETSSEQWTSVDNYLKDKIMLELKYERIAVQAISAAQDQTMRSEFERYTLDPQTIEKWPDLAEQEKWYYYRREPLTEDEIIVTHRRLRELVPIAAIEHHLVGEAFFQQPFMDILPSMPRFLCLFITACWVAACYFLVVVNSVILTTKGDSTTTSSPINDWVTSSMISIALDIFITSFALGIVKSTLAYLSKLIYLWVKQCIGKCKANSQKLQTDTDGEKAASSNNHTKETTDHEDNRTKSLKIQAMPDVPTFRYLTYVESFSEIQMTNLQDKKLLETSNSNEDYNAEMEPCTVLQTLE